MMCLRHFLVFLMLLPFPTASPLFMFLFIITMFSKLRPCGYCSVLMVVTFFSTCSSSFLYPASLTTPSNPPTQLNHTSPSFLYTSPLPSRCWCDLNAGRLLWPVVEGYRVIDEERVKRSEKKKGKVQQEFGRKMEPTGTEEEEPQPEEQVRDGVEGGRETEAPEVLQKERGGGWVPSWWAPTPRPQTPISHSTQSSYPAATPTPTDAPSSSSPPDSSPYDTPDHAGRFDLRFSSIGLVVDFGDWRGSRTEGAVRKEVGEWIEWEKEREGRESWGGWGRRLLGAKTAEVAEEGADVEERGDENEAKEDDDGWKIREVVGGMEREL